MNFLKVLLYSSLLLLAGALVYNFFYLDEQPRSSSTSDLLAEEAIIKLDEFDKVEVGGSIYLEVTQGNKRTVEVMTEDPALRDRVIISQKGNTLKVDLSRGWQESGDIQVVLTTPDIERVSLGGTSHLHLSDPIQQAKLFIDLSGASHFDGTVEVTSLILSQSGSSSTKITGSAQQVQAKVSGSSVFNGEKLSVAEMGIKASGAARADVNVTETLSARASGSAYILCKGTPSNVTKSTSGAGNIKVENKQRQPNNQL